MTRSILVSLVATAALATAAPALARPRSPDVGVTAVRPAQALVAQSSCGAARDRIFDWAAHAAVEAQFSYNHHHRYPRGGATRSAEAKAPSQARAESTAGAPAAADTGGPGHYTKTNVQEAGVDEADMVKTDGRHVYAVIGREVVIARTWPVSAARVVGRHELPAQVTPQQLFLSGDRLVVLSHVYEHVQPPAAGRAQPAAMPFYGTRVTLLDVEDRAAPEVVHEADIEGYTAQARMIGDDVYLVSNAGMTIPPAITQAAHDRASRLRPPSQISSTSLAARKKRAFRAVRAHLNRSFGRARLAGAMPRQRHARRDGSMGAARPLYACGDLHVPAAGAQLGTLNLIHLDVSKPEALAATGVLASGWQVYASEEALYAAMPNYGWSHIWGWDPSERPAATHNTTDIYKFAIADGRPRYAAAGRVRGMLLNQFSMSEHEGYLRVATTDQGWSPQGGSVETGNHLYVLGERGRRLRVVGAVEDLAPGERIYSARMMGDKGYMVTFRQTDPLYTFDLSDPRRPRVVGELKINGFSSYIHPLGPNHLLTIGQDATDEGRVLGAHLQIFDVSDPARPRRTAHRRLADDGEMAWSSAQWDHHAFTYDPRTGVLAVPMTSYASGDPSRSFFGMVVFQVKRDRFRELGRISHAALAAETRRRECAAATNSVPQCANVATYPDWRAQVQRSILIDDDILTLSQLGLQVNPLVRPTATRARVLFAASSPAIAR